VGGNGITHDGIDLEGAQTDDRRATAAARNIIRQSRCGIVINAGSFNYIIGITLDEQHGSGAVGNGLNGIDLRNSATFLVGRIVQLHNRSNVISGNADMHRLHEEHHNVVVGNFIAPIYRPASVTIPAMGFSWEPMLSIHDCALRPPSGTFCQPTTVRVYT